MNVVKILSVAIVALVAIILLRSVKPELAIVLTIASVITLIIVVLDELFQVVLSLYQLADSTNIDSQSLSSVVKIIGIGYMTEFGNNICVDANCKSIGDKVLLAGKIAIMMVALPIITQLVNMLVGILV